MLVPILSDIHANLYGLNAVLEHLERQLEERGADWGDVADLWLLGDIVGYGPHSSACVERLMEVEGLLASSRLRAVCGNHEYYYFGLEDASRLAVRAAELTVPRKGFSPKAKKWLEDRLWTHEGLAPPAEESWGPEAAQEFADAAERDDLYLANYVRLSADQAYGSCACTMVHGGLRRPSHRHWPNGAEGVPAGGFIPSPREVARDLDLLRSRHQGLQGPRILFCGHSHMPALWAEAPGATNPTPWRWHPGKALALESGWSYLINVGAVGLWRLPRSDGYANTYYASYALLEVSDTVSVTVHRVAYEGCSRLAQDITRYARERKIGEDGRREILRQFYLD